MTAPINGGVTAQNFQKSIAGRSRSSSRSGGVVFTTRPRAASEAARTAMEAMIMARLDRITKRLGKFNAQAQDLHMQTQQLAQAFQGKARRMYMVEDHLLRIQGKPGLSEAYLENGGATRQRRLTDDLEELSMGVRSLRKKFQAAGTVVSTEREGLQGDLHGIEPSATADSEPAIGDNGDPQGPVRKKEVWAPEKISTAPDSSSTLSDLAEQVRISSPKDSLESPQHQTPPSGLRSPPLTPRAPLSGSLLLQPKGLEDRPYRSRPLSIIPDLEEPSSVTPVTLMMATALSDKDLSSLGPNAPGSSSEQQKQRHQTNVYDINNEPRPVGMHAHVFSLPASTSSAPTTSASGVTNGSNIQQARANQETEEIETATALHEPTTEQKTEAQGSTQIGNDGRNTGEDENGPSQEGWIQALWRFLVHAEYFFLGTAVLGAMMPDNVFALCAGFLSAVMYGILIVHHRLTARLGKEVPHPPTEQATADQKGRAVANVASSKAMAHVSGYGSGSASTSSFSRRAKASTTAK
ncbi:hypothetical protein EDD21DRAFT_379757, partial [Dissophora ornata]